MKKLNGFTLIELIVVIAIIGILAAILVPTLIGFIRDSKAARLNGNAKSIYSAAQLAITDYNNGITGANKLIEPDCVYTGSDDGQAYPTTDDGSGDVCDLTKYLGKKFGGYFAFKTDNMGYGCVYAMWSEYPIPADIVTEPLTEEEVKASMETDLPRGCHPLKAES